MIQKVDPKRDKQIQEFFKNWWNLHTPSLVLTDEDEISVGELRKQDNCPVSRCLERLKNTRKVFFRREDDQWAFSLRKDLVKR